MAVITVHDNSETVELCNTHRLFLKPKLKLLITVILPEERDPSRPIPNREILEQLKNLVEPEHFSSLKVLRNTKENICFEGEADTKMLAQVLLEKLNGALLQLNSFQEPLSIDVTEVPLDSPTDEELQFYMPKPEGDLENNHSENMIPPAIYLEGLPCKWFSVASVSTEKPSEDVLRSAFEKYGNLSNVDIPMLDPYREVVGNLSLGGLQTFEAFLQYEDISSSINAVQALRRMKLMYSSEDGKCLACDIKVSIDTTKHFSEETISKRNAERLQLQELEQQRKQEKEKEAERKRKAKERKLRARKRKARLKRKLQKQKEQEENTQEKDLFFEEVENTEEWEERKLLLAQRRVESINLLSLLLDQINNLAEANRHIEEHMECDFTEDSCDSTISTYSQLSKSLSIGSLKERVSRQHGIESKDDCGVMPPQKKKYFPLERQYTPQAKGKGFTSAWKSNLNYKFQPATFEEEEDETEPIKSNYSEHKPLKRLQSQDTSSIGYCKKIKVYETEEFINYLLNYYDYPEYARLFLQTTDTESKAWCSRVVSYSGDTVHIEVRNMTCNFPEMKTEQQPCHKTDNDEHESKITADIPKSESSSDNECSKECPKETDNHVVKDEPKPPLETARSHCAKDKEGLFAKERKNEDSIHSSESSDELKDVLEQISSTSEYFSEEVSESVTKVNNIRKISKRQRNMACLKKAMSCCHCEKNRICHHEDILGHLLHSYSVCRQIKKHTKCHPTQACHKAKVHLHYDSETSDTDTEKQVCAVRKRKKVKRNPSSCTVEDRNHSKEKCFNAHRLAGVSSEKNSYMWQDEPDNLSYYGEHHRKVKKISNPQQCYIPEHKTECLKQEEHSWDSDESSSWSSSSPGHPSVSTLQSDISSKGSFHDSLEWEHHFYCEEELDRGTKYKM
ncbi:A-kinase anchor protein 17B-like isoform X2 [Xenopus laevis]|nr:A-kinase anchor protein 17B-like isoform X2 [Xenopus laevis]OCT67580.1 hypothetical protein XELAEV_18038877mg [Xenopus laevis]